MSEQPSTFVRKQRIASLSGVACIEDDAGQHAYEVDGRAFHVRRTMKLNDTAKRGDDIVAAHTQGLLSIGDRSNIKLANGGELKARGDISDYDFEVRRGHDVVIHASHSLVSTHDAYGGQGHARCPARSRDGHHDRARADGGPRPELTIPALERSSSSTPWLPWSDGPRRRHRRTTRIRVPTAGAGASVRPSQGPWPGSGG